MDANASVSTFTIAILRLCVPKRSFIKNFVPLAAQLDEVRWYFVCTLSDPDTCHRTLPRVEIPRHTTRMRVLLNNLTTKLTRPKCAGLS